MTFIAFAQLRCCRTFGLSPIVSRPAAPETLVTWGEKWATIQPKLGTKPDFTQLTDNISGTNSVEDLRFLFSHLLLNLPQVLAASVPAVNGGQK